MPRITVKSVTRTQYRQARRLLRSHGKYALLLLDPDARAVIELVADIATERDRLAERASIVDWCKRMGKTCNIRQTSDLASAMRVLNTFSPAAWKWPCA